MRAIRALVHALLLAGIMNSIAALLATAPRSGLHVVLDLIRPAYFVIFALGAACLLHGQRGLTFVVASVLLALLLPTTAEHLVQSLVVPYTLGMLLGGVLGLLIVESTPAPPPPPVPVPQGGLDEQQQPRRAPQSVPADRRFEHRAP